MQTKKQSLAESITNTAVGYSISLLSLFIIFPILGIESSPGKNIVITLYFTLISIVRSYVLRRYFNNKLKPIKEMTTAIILGIIIPINITVNSVTSYLHIRPTEKGFNAMYQELNGNITHTSITPTTLEYNQIVDALKALKKVLKTADIDIYHKNPCNERTNP